MIGGTTAAERNVITGNWRMGIVSIGTMGTTVQGITSAPTRPEWRSLRYELAKVFALLTMWEV